MELDDCFRKGYIKKTRIDTELINSLKEMSDIKETTVKTANIDKNNISAYVSLAYDSLREILETICINNGYKVYNHTCIGELLNNILSNFDYELFDRIRYIRNGINYYGTKIELAEGLLIIENIFKFKTELQKI